MGLLIQRSGYVPTSSSRQIAERTFWPGITRVHSRARENNPKQSDEMLILLRVFILLRFGCTYGSCAVATFLRPPRNQT